MDQIPITREGYDRLGEELKTLKSIERPAIIQAIAEARAHGDLSENAEYHAARERQSFIEGRIMELEAVISRAQIIDPKALSGETVKFGATIVVVDVDSDEEMTYQIVGEHESDIDYGRISLTAPISRALIGKTLGDVVEVRTPKGLKSYEILLIRFE